MDRSPNLPRKANPWLPRVWAPGGLGSSSCNWRPKISIISSVFGGGGMGRSSRRRPVPGYQTLVRSRLGSKQEGGGAAAGGVRAPFPRAPSLSRDPARNQQSVRKRACLPLFPRPYRFSSAVLPASGLKRAWNFLLSSPWSCSKPAQTARLASRPTARGFSLVVLALNLGTINLSKND